MVTTALRALLFILHFILYNIFTHCANDSLLSLVLELITFFYHDIQKKFWKESFLEFGNTGVYWWAWN